MAICSPSDLVAAGKCFLTLTEEQRESVIAALLCNILKASNPMASCDPAQLLEDGKCFTVRTRQELAAIQTQLLCEILHGGSTGQTCLICLEADGVPVDPAPCDCSICYNLAGQFWFWNSLTNSWIPFIL